MVAVFYPGGVKNQQDVTTAITPDRPEARAAAEGEKSRLDDAELLCFPLFMVILTIEQYASPRAITKHNIIKSTNDQHDNNNNEKSTTY